MTPEKILINHVMMCGNSYRMKTFFKIAYSTIYSIVFFEKLDFIKKRYQFFDTVSQIIICNKHWQLFNNLVFFFLNKIQPLFFLKSVSILNRFKKKKKSLRINPFYSFLSKVPQYKRFNFTAREFCLYFNSLKKFKCYDRISLGLLDILFKNKKSFLWRKKISCYKKVLKSYIKTNRPL